MPKTIRIAAVQMFAQPAPTEERLARAEGLVAQAAQNGAQLVVLPEVFNIGYEYDDRNYACAEAIDGRTATWMKDCAGQYGVHLMGTFLRAEAGDIYNTMLLVAPHGRQWYYDKNYPWMWERAYFRQGKGATVADTELGKIGLLICWDIAHPNLWECYAGRVELIVVSSCPPDASDLTLVLPHGKRVTSTELGPIMRRIKRTAGETFGCYLRRQASHLGVPVVNTAGTGIFRSAIPRPKLSLMTMALACPQLWQYIAQAERVHIETRYFNETYLADARGNVLERVPAEKEGYALAEIPIADAPPPDRGRQPSFGVSKFAYLFDAFANAVLAQEYRRKVKERLRRD